MPPILIIAALATIVITAGLTLLLYRLNAPPGVRRKDGGDGGPIVADAGGRGGKVQDTDGGDSGGSDGDGGD